MKKNHGLNKIILVCAGLTMGAMLYGCQTQNQIPAPPQTQQSLQTQTKTTTANLEIRPATQETTPVVTQQTTPVVTQQPTTKPITPAPKSTSVKISANTPFTLKLGQTGAFDANGATIIFDAVTGDSRCPEGAQCIWEGEGTIQLKTKGFSSTTHDETSVVMTTIENKISLGGDGKVGYALELVDLLPYPKMEQSTGSKEHAATFKLTVDTAGM